MIWIALTISVISLATAVVALWHARAAHIWAEESKLSATTVATVAAERTTVPDTKILWLMDEVVTGEPTAPQLIAATLDDGGALSDACRAVARALDDGGEPPTSSDYTRVQRCSDLFTASVGRMRAPQYGDVVRELTDELVTLHHSVVAEVRQHQHARYPFVGAKDTALANLLLHKFDAELARLRLYAQTGYVPDSDKLPVDFETVRFVLRDPPTQGTPPALNSP